MAKDNIYLGVDIGGTGMKCALIDVKTGKMISERFRIPTPQPATPEAMAGVFAQLTKHFKWKGKVVGAGFPSVVKNGVVNTASNIDKSWIGVKAEKLFSKASGCTVKMMNDADAAGVAEMKFGLGKDAKGVTILVTIGTGIGSALFIDGRLVPNTELGHLHLHGWIAERYASGTVRKRENLDWVTWGKRFNEYLQMLERLFTPDMILLSGGVSKRFDEFSPVLNINAKLMPGQLLNNSGIIGAATYAASFDKKKK